MRVKPPIKSHDFVPGLGTGRSPAFLACVLWVLTQCECPALPGDSPAGLDPAPGPPGNPPPPLDLDPTPPPDFGPPGAQSWLCPRIASEVQPPPGPAP